MRASVATWLPSTRIPPRSSRRYLAVDFPRQPVPAAINPERSSSDADGPGDTTAMAFHGRPLWCGELAYSMNSVRISKK